MTDSPPRLDFEDVSVSFGASTVVRHVSVRFGRGEIVGLLGHNGAGKSTLINAATGAVRGYEGQILVDGVPLPKGASPSMIAHTGVAVIHQEPALAPNLSVLDNLDIGRPGAAAGRAHRRVIARKALDDLGAGDIDIDQPVGSLPLGNRQMVDLARATIAGDIRVLFLDEPTAALGEAETRTLHDIIRRLAANGTTVVYVSHRLLDIVDVCTRVVALREGELTLDSPTADFTSRTLSAALAGDTRLLEDEYEAPEVGEIALEIDGGELQFRSGEIVGLFGMAAGPQFSLLQALYGLRDPLAATDRQGALQARSPRAAMQRSIHLVPGDREKDGLVPDLPAIDNVFLPWLTESEFSSRRDRQARYEEMRAALSIQGPDGSVPISSFSGGNRQKHLLARWIFPRRPQILLLEQPTQGVDVTAKLDIRRCLREVAGAGSTVVVASAESDEVASICDRAYVVNAGRIIPVEKTESFDSDLLTALLSSADS